MSKCQNVCLICCYSFQEKPTRFICDETQESFRKFCKELGLHLEDDDDEHRGHRRDMCNKLELPYGKNITVCGDCLSLVDLYLQQRTIQKGKESKLMELQKAVCVALKDLHKVLEDVQLRIDQLHSTVQMGNESCLDSFSSGMIDEGSNPRMFRAKILKLNTGLVQSRSVLVEKDGHQIPISMMKLEPIDQDENSSIELDGSISEESDFGKTAEVAGCTAAIKNDGKIKGTRVAKRSIKNANKYQSRNEVDDNDSLPDFDDNGDWDDLNCHFDDEAIGPKSNKSSHLCNFEEESRQAASQWKDNLISRILMQMNNAIHEDMDTPKRIKNDDKSSDDSSLDFITSQFVDGMLKLNGVDVKIRETSRALQCTKCKKIFSEQMDAKGDAPVEALMRDHILSKHSGNDAKSQKQRNSLEMWTDVPPVSEGDLGRDWRKLYERGSREIIVTYYCRYGNKRRACPAKLKKILYQNGDVEFKANGRLHENHRGNSCGLSAQEKEFTTELFHKNITRPKEIIRCFRKEGRPEPSITKLKTFLVVLRRKKSR